MATENITISLWLIQWLDDWGILILAIAAFTAPYCVTIFLKIFYAPKLNIEFKNELPYCRHAKTALGEPRDYFCSFAIFNNGRSQVDDCEAVLERVWDRDNNKENSEWKERKNFIPSNLKWCAEDPEEDFERACFKTIYPGGRRYFCDIARIEEERDKFEFELVRPLTSQINYLSLCKHKIQISIYGKNLTKIFFKSKAKLTRRFKIKWKEGWKKTQPEMQKCLEIEMLCENQ